MFTVAGTRMGWVVGKGAMGRRDLRVGRGDMAGEGEAWGGENRGSCEGDML